MGDEQRLPSKAPSVLGVVRTVGSAMFGIRGRKNHERDASAASPAHLILAAVIFMVIFVSIIVSIATLVARH
jgi:hypothetical protein